MTDGFSIRSFRDADAPVLADVYVRAVQHIGSRDYRPDQVQAWIGRGPSPDRLRAKAADGRTTLVAVDPRDRALAFIDLEPDGHIDLFYCDPDAAGGGAASALYADLETIALRAGVVRLYVEASEAARRFFLRRGFTVLHRRDFEIEGVPIHNYAMEKRLQPAGASPA